MISMTLAAAALSSHLAYADVAMSRPPPVQCIHSARVVWALGTDRDNGASIDGVLVQVLSVHELTPVQVTRLRSAMERIWADPRSPEDLRQAELALCTQRHAR